VITRDNEPLHEQIDLNATELIVDLLTARADLPKLLPTTKASPHTASNPSRTDPRAL
jgi:hypothetical protein